MAYVNALLEVHSKNSAIVKKCFNNEPGFAASLNKACREFVNHNAATGASSTRSPELFAKGADVLLHTTAEEDNEAALNRVVRLFHLVTGAGI